MEHDNKLYTLHSMQCDYSVEVIPMALKLYQLLLMNAASAHTHTKASWNATSSGVAILSLANTYE